MPSFDILAAFFIAASLFAYLPGPAMLYATAQTISRGWKAGWLAALGIHLGGYFHVATAAIGLAVLFELVPAAYTVMKLAGAAYLMWLGIKLLRASRSTEPYRFRSTKNPRRAFWESVIVEVLNPKTALFYLAFLPQFTDATAQFPIWLQLLILGTIVNVLFSSADVICVVLAGKMATMMRHSRLGAHIAKRIGGALLIALGVNLALSRR